ncbi:AMP-binding protein [Advenella kashmirensis]|nr:AMP-binding protein [Advenella kashmirensis]
MSDQRFVWYPPMETIQASNIAKFLHLADVDDYDELLKKAEKNPEWFWKLIIDRVTFSKPYSTLLDLSGGVQFPRWCVGGEGNIVLDCLDRHQGTSTWSKEFLVWEAESGEVVRWTYADLHREVCRVARSLDRLAITVGDVVGLFLPNIPHAIAAFLACAKKGVIALPLFSGFGSNALKDRLEAAGAIAVITADGTSRRGMGISMKAVADEAVETLGELKHVIVVRNADIDVVWNSGRDHWLDDLVGDESIECSTVHLAADAPLMLMYTSGTSGKPKGTVHTHLGFATKMLLDVGLVMDLKATDRMLWMSDMGWLVGPIVAAAVPLHGASVVLAEGGPDYPDEDRMWRLIDDHTVTFLGLAPTLARSFIRNDGSQIEKYSLTSLRVCVSTGEVWTPEAWLWTFENVCKKKIPLLNYSGGTEIGGGILCGTVIHPIKPCAFTRPIPGMGARIFDESGKQVLRGEVGELVLTSPSPGRTRSLWRSDDTYLDAYWSTYPGVWRHGDWAVEDSDGWWEITGRSDDILKIAGKRTGPSEIEALIAGTGLVVESAVIGLPDPVKGQAVVCVVTVKRGVVADKVTQNALVRAVVKGLGPPFKPQAIIFVDELPKTRNMKVMRRLVRAACLGHEPGDLSALVNPDAFGLLRDAAATANLK